MSCLHAITWVLLCHVAGASLAGATQNVGASPEIMGKPGLAESLYLQLCNAKLDSARVYRVREISLARDRLHIVLKDGTIAFTEDVGGQVTGAFFEGDGEVLLSPPQQAERASMALFTRAAILEETFSSGYLRFNDDTFEQLKPALNLAEHGSEFTSRWGAAARELAEADGLRLFMTFSNSLPEVSTGGPSLAASQGASASMVAPVNPEDRLLHARLQGRRLGTFDVYYDSRADEQIWAGQLKIADGVTYYDVWTSFTLPHSEKNAPPLHESFGEVSDQYPAKGVSVSECKIIAEIQPPTAMKATALMTVHALTGGQRAVVFELSRFLQVRAILANGNPIEFIHNPAVQGTERSRRGNDLVAVVFPRALAAGESIELKFIYDGEVLSEAGGGLLYVGARGTWYPNRGLAMVKYDLEFHYPAGWTLVATGNQTSPVLSPTAIGEHVSRWISERPMPLAGFNLGKYSHFEARAGSLMVNAYATPEVERGFPEGEGEKVLAPSSPSFNPSTPPPLLTIPPAPPSPSRNAQHVADSSASAVVFFAQHFGPYPYGSLSITEMPGELSQGWPGLIFLSSFSFLTDDERTRLHMNPVQRTLSNMVITHETAHQWWGDLVSWSSYRDQWIMEALANYSALLQLETRDAAQFDAAMNSYRDGLLEKNKDGDTLAEAGAVTLGYRLSSSHFPSGYETVSYGRGTWLFHMLRCMLRDAEFNASQTAPLKLPHQSRGRSQSTSPIPTEDEPFMRALRRLRQQYEGKPISSAELLHGFEEQLPPSLWFERRKSLDWFYKGWIEGTSVPHFELQSVKFSQTGAIAHVSGVVLQKSAPQNLVTPVPIYASLAGKYVFLGRVFADGPETSFRLSAPPGTRKVVIDPGHTLLSRNR